MEDLTGATIPTRGEPVERFVDSIVRSRVIAEERERERKGNL